MLRIRHNFLLIIALAIAACVVVVVVATPMEMDDDDEGWEWEESEVFRADGPDGAEQPPADAPTTQSTPIDEGNTTSADAIVGTSLRRRVPCEEEVTRCVAKTDCGPRSSFIGPFCSGEGSTSAQCDCFACILKNNQPCKSDAECGGLKGACVPKKGSASGIGIGSEKEVRAEQEASVGSGEKQKPQEKSCNCEAAARKALDKDVKGSENSIVTILSFCTNPLLKCTNKEKNTCHGLPCKGKCFLCPLAQNLQ